MEIAVYFSLCFASDFNLALEARDRKHPTPAKIDGVEIWFGIAEKVDRMTGLRSRLRRNAASLTGY